MVEVLFQLLDVDYVMVGSKAVVRLFGKGADGKTVCAFYEDYKPYFYADGENAKEVLKNEGDVFSIENVERKIPGVGRRQMLKVTLNCPAKTPEIREHLNAAGVKTFEADILFRYRFMTDFGLAGLDWVAADGTPVQTGTVHADVKVQAKTLKRVKNDENAAFKTMAFDIECVAEATNSVPNSRKDPVVMISMAFSTPYNKQNTIVLSTRRGRGATLLDDEPAMLQEFLKITEEFDPDFLTGYNCNNFDIPYLLDRMAKYNIRPLLGRCTQKPLVARKFGHKFRVSVIGRTIVDSFEIIKKSFSLQRYGLDFVAEKLIGEKKEPVKKSQIDGFWKGTQEEYERLVVYSEKDSILALNLLIKLTLTDKYIALSKISGILLQDTLDGGETSRIENYLLREFNRDGYVLPCKPDVNMVGERDKRELGGGEVLEPIKGLHSFIAVLDFKSMYPSIIRALNICPTTLVTGESDVKDLIVAASGARFMPKNIQKGIVPGILESLMNARQDVKDKLKKCRDPDKKRLLNAHQWALKIMANAFYGYFGYSRSRLFNLAIANAITATGRSTILKTRDLIEKQFGYKVVYGDTDSVFVRIPEGPMDGMAQVAQGIAKSVTEQLPQGIELDFEKIFKRFLPLTKKRYAALSMTPGPDGWEESIEMKGIETVRRDWCSLVGTTMRDVLEIILKKNDVKGAVKHFKGVAEALMKGGVPISQLITTKTITKAPRSYAGVQPHIELAKKMQDRATGDVPGVGDRIGFVIVKGTQMLSKRAEDPVYVVEKGLPIDSDYYIQHQLLPPIERIFAGLGISTSELMGNGKQMGLLDMFNRQKPQRIPEIQVAELDGFVCSRCSRFYGRVPLIGVCECGGGLLFSSRNGPAEQVLLA